MVEREAVERSPTPVVGRALPGGPEGAVEFVAGLVAAGQAERVHVVVGVALAVERLAEGDAAFRQGAGLVREQDLDVAEIFDADQALDDHPAPCQPPRAGGQADGDDRRKQLRRQADGDREGKQGRLQQRAAKGGVDHEDRARQHHGHDREQLRERLQPLLERGLALTLTQSQRDRAERGQPAGANHDAPPVPGAHERAHERTRTEIE